MSTAERFWSKVDKRPDGCWVWTAARNQYGYGRIYVATIDGRKLYSMAHRWAYEAEVGPIPEGLDLDHLCRNRACVNPAHLEPVTRAVNVQRGIGPTLRVLRAQEQTHCKSGHLLAGDNLVPDKSGRRNCRECHRARGRESQRRRRARKAA